MWRNDGWGGKRWHPVFSANGSSPAEATERVRCLGSHHQDEGGAKSIVLSKSPTRSQLRYCQWAAISRLSGDRFPLASQLIPDTGELCTEHPREPSSVFCLYCMSNAGPCTFWDRISFCCPGRHWTCSLPAQSFKQQGWQAWPRSVLETSSLGWWLGLARSAFCRGQQDSKAPQGLMTQARGRSYRACVFSRGQWSAAAPVTFLTLIPSCSCTFMVWDHIC